MVYRFLEPFQGAGLQRKGASQDETANHSWQGNGSVISFNSGDHKGYGLTKDVVNIGEGAEKPIAFFQWQIDGRDGKRLEISADKSKTATITYGPWNNRGVDRTYKQVRLPFLLDPARDGFSDDDGTYYTIAISLDKGGPSQSIQAKAVHRKASAVKSDKAGPIVVDGHLWQGNGSLISAAPLALTGYGLSQDELLMKPSSESLPQVAYVQWQVDDKVGSKLKIHGPEVKVSITYGSWNGRSKDVTHRDVILPYIVDPEADGVRAEPGNFLVVRIEIESPLKLGATIDVEAVR